MVRNNKTALLGIALLFAATSVASKKTTPERSDSGISTLSEQKTPNGQKTAAIGITTLTPITGLGLTFKGDQGTYLCPVKFADGFNGVGFVKEKSESCRFYVENLDNGRVRLKDHTLRYLRHTDHKGGSLIEPRQKTPAESSELIIYKKNGRVVFQAADTGLFLTRIDGRYTMGVMTLEAAKQDSDDRCEFLAETFL